MLIISEMYKFQLVFVFIVQMCNHWSCCLFIYLGGLGNDKRRVLRYAILETVQIKERGQSILS